MRSLLLSTAIFCLFLANKTAAQNSPREELRVPQSDAAGMRSLHGNEAFKISREDLEALIRSSKAANDTFVFFLVKITDNQNNRARYVHKFPDADPNKVAADWKRITSKKPTSVLVGFVPGGQATMRLNQLPWRVTTSVYDLSVVCPPPPDCDCEIAQ
jgi:hypothetical protein